MQLVVNAGVDLASAMRLNPHLRVIFLNGYFDLATPFGLAEYDASHMLLDDPIRRNVAFRYYAGGHMLYMNNNVVSQMHDDLAAFIAVNGD